jgi:hypothetical protein
VKGALHAVSTSIHAVLSMTLAVVLVVAFIAYDGPLDPHKLLLLIGAWTANYIVHRSTQSEATQLQ